MKRSVRVLALLMALIILFACPLRVAATSVVVGQAIVTGASALLVVAGILYGLGVMPSSDPTVFETTRDAGVEYLKAGGHIDDEGFMEIIGYQDPTGVLRTYVSQNIIESVRDWLFGSNVVSSFPGSGSIVSSGWSINSIWDSSYSPAQDCYFVGWYTSDATYTTLAYAFIPLDYSSSITAYRIEGSKKTAISQGSYIVHPDATSSIFIPFETRVISNSSLDSSLLAGLHNVNGLSCSGNTSETIQYLLFGSAALVDYTCSEGLALGEIVGTDVKIETGYETWVDESIISIDVGIQFEDDPEDPNDDDKNIVPFWPVHTGNSLPTGTVHEMQSAAQSGLTDLEIDFSGGSGSGNGSNTGDSPGTSTNPSENVSKFALDLTEFFPFCIPFDIYEFLSILAAEPEAPVFHWEIPVPQLNKTFEFDVDLSVWDDIAQLFRNLELLAFIIGLAMVTRDKFIRG